jgi:hypothetical protein
VCCVIIAWLVVVRFSAIAAQENVDPCGLLTIAEVEQVIGKVKGQPAGDKEGQASWCNYEFVNGKDAMEVFVFPADGIERGRKASKKPVTVKGLGDDAFMDRGMHGIDYVNLFIKKKDVTVKLSLKESAGDEDKLKVLAQKAVGRF